MCTRYSYGPWQADELGAALGLPVAGCDATADTLVLPTDAAPLLMEQAGEITLCEARFGFAGPKGLVLNARAETLRQKPMFAPLWAAGRAVAPAARYYEWTDAAPKVKVAFSAGEDGVLWLAALARREADGLRYVVVTTQPNDTVKDVHDRMPLILTAGQARQGVGQAEEAEALLHVEPPPMVQRRESVEQMNFL